LSLSMSYSVSPSNPRILPTTTFESFIQRATSFIFSRKEILTASTSKSTPKGKILRHHTESELKTQYPGSQRPRLG
jgi:hypothetical protein